jgi:transposase
MDKRRLDEDTIAQLSIDEKSFGSGQNYITVLLDPVGKRILDVAKDRDVQATSKLIKDTLTEKQLESVQSVSMDMWEPYLMSIKKLMPQADIVHDMFHIVRYLNEGIDNTRKSESKKNPILADSKYALLKNAHNRTEQQRVKFFELMDTNLKTADAWAFAETFKQIFNIKFEDIAKAWAYFDMWIDQVNKSLIQPMVKVASTMQNHAVGIVNNVKHKISNALSERFNGKIQTLNVIGRGYRTFENYRSAILFFNGKLDLLSHYSL